MHSFIHLSNAFISAFIYAFMHSSMDLFIYRNIYLWIYFFYLCLYLWIPGFKLWSNIACKYMHKSDLNLHSFIHFIHFIHFIDFIHFTECLRRFGRSLQVEGRILDLVRLSHIKGLVMPVQ